MISESMMRSDLSIKEYPCVYPGLLITGVCLITYFAYLFIWIPVHEKFQIFDSQGLHFSY